jgi:hypothetical protein
MVVHAASSGGGLFLGWIDGTEGYGGGHSDVQRCVSSLCLFMRSVYGYYNNPGHNKRGPSSSNLELFQVLFHRS